MAKIKWEKGTIGILMVLMHKYTLVGGLVEFTSKTADFILHISHIVLGLVKNPACRSCIAHVVPQVSWQERMMTYIIVIVV